MMGLLRAPPPLLPSGCLICLGQSTFLRFNHPAEAKWMKSMIPGVGQSPAAHQGLLPGRRLVRGFRLCGFGQGWLVGPLRSIPPPACWAQAHGSALRLSSSSLALNPGAS